MKSTSADETIIQALCPGPGETSVFGVPFVMYASRSAMRAASSAGVGPLEATGAGTIAHARIGRKSAIVAMATKAAMRPHPARAAQRFRAVEETRAETRAETRMSCAMRNLRSAVVISEGAPVHDLFAGRAPY